MYIARLHLSIAVCWSIDVTLMTHLCLIFTADFVHNDNQYTQRSSAQEVFAQSSSFELHPQDAFFPSLSMYSNICMVAEIKAAHIYFEQHPPGVVSCLSCTPHTQKHMLVNDADQVRPHTPVIRRVLCCNTTSMGS